MGVIMVCMFLFMVSLVTGLILVINSSGRGRLVGWYMIVAAILLLIASILLYSAGHYDLWQKRTYYY